MVAWTSTGPNLVTANAVAVSNAATRGFVVSVTCVNPEAVSYRVTSSIQSLEVSDNENQGVLHPEQTCSVVFVMSDDRCISELAASNDRVEFQVHASSMELVDEGQAGAAAQQEQDVRLQFEPSELEAINIKQDSKQSSTSAEGAATDDDEFASPDSSPSAKVAVEAIAPQKEKVPVAVATPKPTTSKKTQDTKPKEKTKTVKKPDVPVEPKTKDLISVHPTKLTYTPPYALNKKCCSVELQSRSDKVCAFRVRANALAWKLFAVNPVKGVVDPSSRMKTMVDFTMLDNFMQDELNIHAQAYQFNVQVVTCTDGMAAFPEDIPKNTQVQSIILNVELKASEGIQFKNEPVTDLNFIDEPTKPPPQPSAVASEPAVTKKLSEPNANVKKDLEAVFNSKTVPLKAQKDSKKTSSNQTKLPEAPKAVQLSTQVIKYNPPYGVKPQSVMVAVKNISEKKLAYRIQTNKKKYYNIKPTKGMLNAQETCHVEFEMSASLTANELLSDTDRVFFCITIIANLPNTIKKVENDIWKVMELKRKNDVQRINLDVVHEGTGQRQPPKPPLMPQPRPQTPSQPPPPAKGSDGKVGSGPQKTATPTLVNVTPTKLSFKGPYGAKKKTTLTVSNKSSKDIGYKVQCNKCMYYLVNNSKGILAPGKSAQVIVELNEKFTPAEWKKYTAGSHKFHVIATGWIKEVNTFDPKTFDKMKSKESQGVTLDVDLLP